MTVFIKTLGGRIQTGRLNGAGEIYYSDENGNGQVYKGNFLRGKLHDAAGVLIDYTNEGFVMYTGNFVNGIMNGTIEVIEQLSLPENTQYTDGNGPNGDNGLRIISAYRNDTVITVDKKSVVYDNGVANATLDDTASTASVTQMAQKELNSGRIFSDLQIAEL